jgi:hypothetical protein
MVLFLFTALSFAGWAQSAQNGKSREQSRTAELCRKVPTALHLAIRKVARDARRATAAQAPAMPGAAGPRIL